MPLTTVSDVNTFSLWASHACSKQQQNPVCHIISSLPSFYSSFDLCCCCCLKSSGRRAHCSVNVCVCPFVYGLHFQWGYKRKKNFWSISSLYFRGNKRVRTLYATRMSARHVLAIGQARQNPGGLPRLWAGQLYIYSTYIYLFFNILLPPALLGREKRSQSLPCCAVIG